MFQAVEWPDLQGPVRVVVTRVLAKKRNDQVCQPSLEEVDLYCRDDFDWRESAALSNWRAGPRSRRVRYRPDGPPRRLALGTVDSAVDRSIRLGSRTHA